MIKHIVIVGGGSAGWLSAGTLAATHSVNCPQPIKITLIESSDIKSIGVGEGTWPSMRNSLEQMGISEYQFISECDVSFKQGSKFVGWDSEDGRETYYHPFTTPPGYAQTNLAAQWAMQHNRHNFADTVSVQSHVCKAQRAPKQFSTPEFAGVANYGYHLDAKKFADLLTRHCTQNLNVQHIKDTVEQLIPHLNGDIDAIKTSKHGLIKGDLFIDCTGSKSLLLGEHYKVPMLNQESILFNNNAIAVQVPYEDEHAQIDSATIATAQNSGWTWDIGLQSRRGVGFVYSSNFIDDNQASDTLLSYVRQTVSSAIVDKLQPRKISFSPGYRQQFWVKNCLAIGMSAGFIEPLEASALAMVELSATMLRDDMPADRAHMDFIAKRFNSRFTYRWERIIEFLKLHYVLSHRKKSEYWRAHQDPASIPAKLIELLDHWQYQPPSRLDFIENEEIFPSASYQYVLYGMRFKTQYRKTGSDLNHQTVSERYIQDNFQKKDKYIQALPSNRELLKHIKSTWQGTTQTKGERV